MIKAQYYRYYLPILLFFLMLADSHVSSNLMSFFSVPLTFSSHLLLLCLMYSTFIVDKVYLVSWTAIIGLLYDSYYYNVIGINLILLPLIVFVMYFLFSHVETNYFTLILSFIIFVTLISVGRVMLLSIFNLTHTTFLDFVTRNLGPTLLLNSIYICTLVVPLSKIYGISKSK